MRRRLAALLAAVAGPAFAQDRPAVFPTRDAAVTYRVTGAGAASPGGDELRIAYLAAERKARTDGTPGIWTVVEHATRSGLMVSDAERRAMRVPLNPASLARTEPSPDARFERRGSDRIVGHACIVWNWRVPNGYGTSCITAEGIILRTEVTFAGSPARLEAVAVTLDAQDPARFRPPGGYEFRDETRRTPRR